jgi:hypothetical protein
MNHGSKKIKYSKLNEYSWSFHTDKIYHKVLSSTPHHWFYKYRLRLKLCVYVNLLPFNHVHDSPEIFVKYLLKTKKIKYSKLNEYSWSFHILQILDLIILFYYKN